MNMKGCIKYIFLCVLVMTYGSIYSKTDKQKREKPIVVVVCSYNNSEWSNNTLDSIFSQNYSNFRLIIVDDCSTDGNQQVIQQYIDEHNIADRVTFIQNTARKRKLFNLYRVLYECED